MRANDLKTPVVGFSHVNLHVDDLAAAKDFYGHGLGLVELERPDGIGAGVWYRVGPIQLHLSVVPEMPADAAMSTTHIAVRLRADTFDECVAAMETRGVVITRRPQTRDQLGVPVRTAFCRDPSSNLIELTDVGAFG